MSERAEAIDESRHDRPFDHEAIIVGAGVCGIYLLHRLLDLGVDVTLVERGEDLGGTWYWNRYPGARFDSESVTYGYSFSQELLDEWDWKERFSGQPENLRYLNFVADKFDLRPHMQFGCSVDSAVWDDDATAWHVHLGDGRELHVPLPAPRRRAAVGSHLGPRRGPRRVHGRVASTRRTGPRASSWRASGWPSSAPARPACRSSVRSPTRSVR